MNRRGMAHIQRRGMAHIPAEIVADILSRLPVEPILRFRCVSKRWCSLIDSRDFIKLHLKRSAEAKSNGDLIIFTEGISLYSIPLYSLEVAVELDRPPPLKNWSPCEVLGSCDGLVLVRSDDNFAIWNPSTRKYHNLPITDNNIIEIIEPQDFFYGIGYDSIHDDYKVVMIVRNSDTGHLLKFYSLKMNSWTKVIADFPYQLFPLGEPRGGMLASGALHWHAYGPGDKRVCIVAIDLATEGYRRMPMPSDIGWEDSFLTHLWVLEGCLCLLNSYIGDPFDVWVMKDYEVKESWTKLFSVPDSDLIVQYFPVAFSMDGTKVLLVKPRDLLWFDLKCEVLNPVNFRGLPYAHHARLCVQSLVPVGTGGESRGKKQHLEESKDMKREKDCKEEGWFSVGGIQAWYFRSSGLRRRTRTRSQRRDKA